MVLIVYSFLLGIFVNFAHNGLRVGDVPERKIQNAFWTLLAVRYFFNSPQATSCNMALNNSKLPFF